MIEWDGKISAYLFEAVELLYIPVPLGIRRLHIHVDILGII